MNIKIFENMKKKSADSLDYRRILKKFESNPWIGITVHNYTLVFSQNWFFSKIKDQMFSKLILI